MTQDVLKMALDFVENGYLSDWRGITERQLEVITAIKEALAKEKTLQALHSENERLGLYKEAYAQPEQVIQDSTCARHCEANAFQITIKNLRAQLATPPQRTWVGLTNNEIQPIADEYRILFGSWVEDFARAIEAKLKDRNDHSI